MPPASISPGRKAELWRLCQTGMTTAEIRDRINDGWAPQWSHKTVENYVRNLRRSGGQETGPTKNSVGTTETDWRNALRAAERRHQAALARMGILFR